MCSAQDPRAGAAVPGVEGSKPNIVIMFIDDMGYGDIGPFGNTVNQTPNLDRMAEEGIKLTQFYVANTACTPSRAALADRNLRPPYWHGWSRNGGFSGRQARA